MSINVTTDKIRNVALVGHQGNGKTTLAEAMLSAAGVINRIGRVEDGNTVLDNDPEEHARCQSLSMGLASFAWGDHWINLLDTPGYADFAGDAHAALAVADLAVFVIDAVSGPQVHDDMMWAAAAERSMPRMIFVNKMDRSRASFDRTVDQLRSHFGPGIEPIELPIGEEADFHGIADLLTEHAFLYDSGTAVETEDLPPETAEREHAEHEHLVEDVVELADDLLAKYLDGEEISVRELEAALHEGVDAATVWPLLVGSGLTGIGVDRLLEFVCHVGPAPSDLPGTDVEAAGETMTVVCDPAGQPLAHVFKTLTDDYVGQLSLFKVLSGSIKADATLVNPRTGKSERLHSLLRVVGSEHTATTEVVAGEIAAAIKLGDVATGDTLAPSGSPVRVPVVDYSDPVYGVALTAAAKADDDKLAVALQKLVHEDPTLRVHHDAETHQIVLRGAGDAHVQVALARLRNRYGVEVDTERVRVAYRETLAGPVETEGRHKKQSGGRGQYGVASVQFEPLPEGAGFEFVDKVTGGAIPRQLIPAVGKGIHESMLRGGPHGFPVVDVKATVFDGKYHAVDSDEMSFKMAGALALRAAIERVGTVVLEPVSRLHVTAPTDLQGDVMADLSSRRGQIETTEQGANGDVTVIAIVPTSETIDYAVALRSMTHGRGRFHTDVSHYQILTGPLPKSAQPDKS